MLATKEPLIVETDPAKPEYPFWDMNTFLIEAVLLLREEYALSNRYDPTMISDFEVIIDDIKDQFDIDTGSDYEDAKKYLASMFGVDPNYPKEQLNRYKDIDLKRDSRCATQEFVYTLLRDDNNEINKLYLIITLCSLVHLHFEDFSSESYKWGLLVNSNFFVNLYYDLMHVAIDQVAIAANRDDLEGFLNERLLEFSAITLCDFAPQRDSDQSFKLLQENYSRPGFRFPVLTELADLSLPEVPELRKILPRKLQEEAELAQESPIHLISFLSDPFIILLTRDNRIEDIAQLIGISIYTINRRIKIWSETGQIDADFTTLNQTAQYCRIRKLTEEIGPYLPFEFPPLDHLASISTLLSSIQSAFANHIITENEEYSRQVGYWVWPDENQYLLYSHTLGLEIEHIAYLHLLISRIRKAFKNSKTQYSELFGRTGRRHDTTYFLNQIKAIASTRRSQSKSPIETDTDEIFTLSNADIDAIRMYMIKTLQLNGISKVEDFPNVHSNQFNRMFCFTYSYLNRRLREIGDPKWTSRKLYESLMREIDPEFDISCSFYNDTPINSPEEFAEKLIYFLSIESEGEDLPPRCSVQELSDHIPRIPLLKRVISLSRKINSLKAYCRTRGYSPYQIVVSYNNLIESKERCTDRP